MWSCDVLFGDDGYTHSFPVLLVDITYMKLEPLLLSNSTI